jgi:hypothetical protein
MQTSNALYKQIAQEMLSLTKSFENHRTDFSHPYKTEREVKVTKAKAFGQAFLSLLNDFDLTVEEVMDEVVKKTPTKKK